MMLRQPSRWRASAGAAEPMHSDIDPMAWGAQTSTPELGRVAGAESDNL